MDGHATLVAAAASGSQSAWNDLVDRFAGLVWSVARAHRLSQAEAADVSQTTWLRLVEHIDDIRDPERVGAWLATTAKRESLRLLRTAGRQVSVGDERDFPEVPTPGPDAQVLQADRDHTLWRAVDSLPDRCRMLLRVLMADPPPSYEVVSAALSMPVGSIGPTRARCLVRLRGILKELGISDLAGGSQQ